MSTAEHRATPVRTSYAAALAAFIVAVLEPYILPTFGHDVLDWAVYGAIANGCAILALLALRSHLRDRAHGAAVPRALLGLAIVYGGYGLLETAQLLGRYDILFSPSLVAGGFFALRPLAAALFAFVAIRVHQARADSHLALALFAALAALGSVLRLLGAGMAITAGTILCGAAFAVLGFVFLRTALASPAAGSEAAVEGSGAAPPNKGKMVFGALVVGLAAASSAIFAIAEAQNLQGPLVILSVFLLAPQYAMLDGMGIGEASVLLFPLALVTFPILLLPTGSRLITGRPPQLWITIALQTFFFIVYAVIDAVVLVSGIRG